MTERKSKMLPLSQLTLLDRFLFDAAMEDNDFHKNVLQIILGKEIAFLTKNETEKELRVSPLLRSVRMDVYAMDEDGIIYNSEMQKQLKKMLVHSRDFSRELTNRICVFTE